MEKKRDDGDRDDDDDDDEDEREELPVDYVGGKQGDGGF